MAYELIHKKLAPLEYLPADGLGCVITVRLPLQVHVQLKEESYGALTSLNRFCLSKLIAGIDDCLIVPECVSETAEFAAARHALLFGGQAS